MSGINDFLKDYQFFCQDELIQSFDDNLIVVYFKLEDFFLIEDFYDVGLLFKIQNKVRDFMEAKLKKHIPSLKKVYLLGNGEYSIIINKRNIESINDFIIKLRTFQRNAQDKLLVIDSIHYQVSLLVSVAFSYPNKIESARFGIKKLLKTHKNFIIANNLAKKQKIKTMQNLQIINTIKKAIKNSTVVTYFQPIVNNYNGEVEKYESLIRIKDENNRLLYPRHFLNVAKMGKYYYQLTRIVLQHSFKVAMTHDVDVSINLSIRDIESNLTKSIIFNLLKKYQNHTHRITFELLEDENIKDMQTIADFIKKVKEQGVKIAIDDFGSGFSNFERLFYYKPDILKIDGFLIRNIDTNRYSYSIVKTIVNFAKEENIQTVAEFVENEAIQRCICELGIDYSQGYYFGKPRSFEEL